MMEVMTIEDMKVDAKPDADVKANEEVKKEEATTSKTIMDSVKSVLGL